MFHNRATGIYKLAFVFESYIFVEMLTHIVKKVLMYVVAAETWTSASSLLITWTKDLKTSEPMFKKTNYFSHLLLNNKKIQ